MGQKNEYYKKLYAVINLVLLLVIVIHALFFTDVFGTDEENQVRDFSDDWFLSSGEKISLDSIKDPHSLYSATIEKQLPEDIRAVDSLCFQSKNVNITAWIDNEEVFRFKTTENITGVGYGFTTHEIGLDKTMAGSVIRISYEGVYPGYSTGYIWGAYICSGADYIRMMTQENLFLMFTSTMILFLGIIIVIFWFVTPAIKAMALDILAFGAMSVIVGVWCIIDTGMPELISGSVISARVLSRFLLPLAIYPFFSFIHSLTEMKRLIYRHVMFYAVMLTIFLFLLLRYVFGLDMIKSFAYGILLLMCILAGTVLVMIFDDIKCCRSEGRTSKLLDIAPGLLIFVACVILDNIFYFLHLNSTGRYFGFMHLGIIIYIISVFVLFQKWWTGERDVVKRDLFVNRALQSSVSSDSPDESIRLLLEYLGTEFQARRVCIYEEGKGGGYRETYEWCRNKLDRKQMESPAIPFEYLQEKIDEEHRFITIGSREDCVKTHPVIVEAMEQRDIERIISGMLESEGAVTGIIELQDPPGEILGEIEDVMGVLSYFFAQFVNQKKEQERVLFYSHHDVLTGTKNYIAYREFTERKLDLSQSFGYVICEIVGLKKLNRKAGYEVGDELLKKMAKSLMDAFGEENVYRVGGDTFAAFGFETDETFFRNDVARAKRVINDEQCKYSFGALYCANGSRSFDTVRKKTMELLGDERDVAAGK